MKVLSKEIPRDETVDDWELPFVVPRQPSDKHDAYSSGVELFNIDYLLVFAYLPASVTFGQTQESRARQGSASATCQLPRISVQVLSTPDFHLSFPHLHRSRGRRLF
jgi:hypothetical protein